MSIYNCRSIRPGISAYAQVEANSPEEAANSFHEDNVPYGIFKSLVYIVTEPNGKAYKVYFACIEVENFGDWISRIYSYCIWRKGGVKSPHHSPTLQEIALVLGYKHDPKTLIEPGWDHEETMQEAETRSANK